MSSGKYDRAARIYDALAWLYSGGGIARAKCAHLNELSPGQRVLYAGAGSGAEAVEAARRGCLVTAEDLSASMCTLLNERASQLAKEHAIEVRRRNALVAHEADGSGFDVVVAPFFLNVFSSDAVGPAVRALASRVRPGGALVIVDFRTPQRLLPLRLLQQLYY